MNTGHEARSRRFTPIPSRCAIATGEHDRHGGAESSDQGSPSANQLGNHRAHPDRRLADGKRKVMSIQEITGMEGEIITMQEIFGFRQTGVAPDGTVLATWRNGRSPKVRRSPARARGHGARHPFRPQPAIRVGPTMELLTSLFGNLFLAFRARICRGGAAARGLVPDVGRLQRAGGEAHRAAPARHVGRRCRRGRSSILKQRMLSESPPSSACCWRAAHSGARPATAAVRLQMERVVLLRHDAPDGGTRFLRCYVHPVLHWMFAALIAAAGAVLPLLYILRKRTQRMRRLWSSCRTRST